MNSSQEEKNYSEYITVAELKYIQAIIESTNLQLQVDRWEVVFVDCEYGTPYLVQTAQLGIRFL